MAAIRRKAIVFLDESASEKTRVQMKDGDTFFIQAADAARACQVWDKMSEFGSQYSSLLVHLAEWVKQRRPAIQTAYLTNRDRDMLFVVMQKAMPFDEELSRELTELDLYVANHGDYSLIDLEVLAIPPVSNAGAVAFLSSGDTIEYAQ